jgi:hypothetical protein
MSLLSYAMRIFSTPPILAYVKDQVGQRVFNRVYAIVRYLVVKPDRPDRISLQSARENISMITEDPLPGLAAKAKPKSSHHPSETFTLMIKTLFPAIFWIWEKILLTQRASLAVELSSDIEEELIIRSTMYYRDLLREDRESRPDLRRAPRTLRIMAIRSAFNDFNLDPDHAVVDIFELADEMSFPPASNGSSPTPEPQDFGSTVPFAPDARQEDPSQEISQPTAPSETADAETDTSGDAARSDNPQDLVAQEESLTVAPSAEAPQNAPADPPTSPPATPLEPLLEHVSSDPEDDPWQRPSTPIPRTSIQNSPAPESPRPDSPIPGISRAVSLPLTTPRPLRRPTDIEEGLRAAREDLLRHGRSWDNGQTEDHGVYRVTLLSNHPAETLALSVASLAESILLFPLEMVFLRSLARTFLSHQSGDMGMTRSTVSHAGMWPLSIPHTATGLGLSGWANLLGNWSITIGLQGLINYMVWKTSTRFVLRLGRRFGWGSM